MRSVRLDPFSAKLFAIRTGHSKAPVRDPPLLDEEPIESVIESPTATDATARGEAPIGAVMESALSARKRAVAPTGCKTCDEHAPTSIAELAQEIADLKARVVSLEDRADRHDHPGQYPPTYQSCSYR